MQSAGLISYDTKILFPVFHFLPLSGCDARAHGLFVLFLYLLRGYVINYGEDVYF